MSAARRRQKRRPERGGRATGPEAGVGALAPASPAAAASRPARSPPSSAAGVWEASPWRPALPGGLKTSRPAAHLAAETHLSVSRAAASPPPPPAAILQPCHSPSAGPSIWAFSFPLFFPFIPSIHSHFPSFLPFHSSIYPSIHSPFPSFPPSIHPPIFPSIYPSTEHLLGTSHASDLVLDAGHTQSLLFRVAQPQIYHP